ncbi:MAG: DNA polymerase I [Deltaproteobacteria bacterium SM23_61]|nr:MAG: DNA polymerase I [Deltaproteobacteria bacterium SM23_61]
MAEKNAKVYLIDGSSYIYRAFFAIAHLSNSKGFPTNAIYVFTNMLLKILREKGAEYAAIAFDAPGPTFRHEAFGEYKANRPSMPEDLRVQVPHIKEVVSALRLPVLEKEGYEADDLIATLARKLEKEGMETVIVSGDKDLMQLVSSRVTMYDPMKDKTFQVPEVKERFGVSPDKVVEVMGLMGDTSDNIPGVPGIGPKTAGQLIEEFGSIEELLKNVGRVKNARVRASLDRHAEQARLSRELATLDSDASLDWALENLKIGEPDRKKLQEIFKEMEFSKLLKDFSLRPNHGEDDYRLITGRAEFEELVGNLRKAGTFALDLESTSIEPMRAEIVGLSFSFQPHQAFYLPVGHTYPGAPGQLPRQEVLQTLRPLLEDPRLKKYGQNIKYDYILLANSGIRLRGIAGDNMIASYLLNPSKHRHSLEELSREYLDRQIITYSDVAGSGAKAIPFSQVTVEKACRYSGEDADLTLQLAQLLMPKIEAEGFADLFHRVELPLIEVLAAMEMNGVRLDLPLLEVMSREFERKMDKISEEIFDLAGEPFNINSPQQLGKILFEKLKLPGGKRTKTGYSTDVEVLNELSRDFPLPAKVLEYRSLSKLKSTYVDALPQLVNPKTGRVHTSFNQTVTATGRLSSSDPNLQNIPIRSPEGRRIREAFIPEQGRLILSADYSQIELRILAHLSGDSLLVETFQEDRDVHAATAGEIFRVSPDQVNPEMRRLAKVINFGIIYGMSAFGLAKELGIQPAVAQAYIANYFQKYHGVRDYIDRSLEAAREKGYVITLMNRRRYLPDIKSQNRSIRQFAERIAINAPIQGTAADLIKAAMIRIHRRLIQEGRESKLTLQIHDELVFEVPEGELEGLRALVKEEMEGVMKLSIPLKVDIGLGKNWAEAH